MLPVFLYVTWFSRFALYAQFWFTFFTFYWFSLFLHFTFFIWFTLSCWFVCFAYHWYTLLTLFPSRLLAFFFFLSWTSVWSVFRKVFRSVDSSLFTQNCCLPEIEQTNSCETNSYRSCGGALCRVIFITFIFIDLPHYPFLRAKAECFARLCHRLGVCLYVRRSVHLSHSWSVSKRCKLGSRNFHCGLPQGL